MPSDHNPFHRGEIEETILESVGNDHSTVDGYSRRTTLSSKLYHTKGKGPYRSFFVSTSGVPYGIFFMK